MDGINFIDRRGRNISLSKPVGAGGNCYYLTVDNYHYGQIVQVLGGKWIAYPTTDKLPTAYWDALVKWIEENEGEQK